MSSTTAPRSWLPWAVAGFRGARLLRRTIGAETEFVSLTFFEDLDAVRSFAGSGL